MYSRSKAEWYLLRSKPRQEGLAIENLERQNFRAFLPLFKSNKHRKGRWVEVEEPMFPGYLFINLDLAHENCSSIRSTRGVSGFVRFGSEPRPVPDSIVTALMCSSSDQSNNTTPLFKSGESVNIVAGGFSGLKAIFQAESGTDRVILLLDLLGRCVNIAVNRNHVVPCI